MQASDTRFQRQMAWQRSWLYCWLWGSTRKLARRCTLETNSYVQVSSHSHWTLVKWAYSPYGSILARGSERKCRKQLCWWRWSSECHFKSDELLVQSRHHQLAVHPFGRHNKLPMRRPRKNLLVRSAVVPSILRMSFLNLSWLGTQIGSPTYVLSHVQTPFDIHLIFFKVILIPRDVGQTCLLLNTGVLTEYQLGKCKEMTSRSYNLFGQPFGFLEGANILDIARLGVDGALLISNMTLISDAYRRIHLEMTLKNEIKADGIRNDGSFGTCCNLSFAP